MVTNALTVIAILILAVGGFVFLVRTMIAVRKHFSQRKGSQSSIEMSGPSVDEAITPADCYRQCMKKSCWASSQTHLCALSCDF